ncbi:protein-L-isoaspartate(D-aspartate) O-methyltransferase [Rhodospirillaceae bacterium SYSU D60014]|uniref:protein-L-isoaspartate(D-aspartate) O-methyltransferase n=1 Tax=Virgifigura deserti TaxID=2268457 RepID=UPI000E66C29E
MSLAARKIRLIMYLRRSGITDTAVLDAVERIPREAFVPQPFLDQAYEDRTLPIGHGQTLSQPQVVALMTQALRVEKRHKVLEIGTGSGYQTAVLSRLARRVYTIERHRSLLREAEERFAALRLHNTVTKAGDGSRGWKEQAPFDRIIVTAAADDVPQALYEQLANGGLLVLPIGPDRGDQELYRISRTEEGPRREKLGDVRFVPLIAGALPKEEDRSRSTGSAGPRGRNLA